jgi:hypothetical protein
MNAAHLHLLVNHLPILGTFFGLALLVAALLLRKDDLRAAALVTLVIVGAAAQVAVRSGENAEHLVEELEGVEGAAVHRHEEAAEPAGWAALATAAAALAALLWRRGRAPLAIATLVLALASAGLMARAGLSGGEIRHPEIHLPPG